MTTTEARTEIDGAFNMTADYTLSVALPGCMPVCDDYPYTVNGSAVLDCMREEMILSYDASPGDTPERDRAEIETERDRVRDALIATGYASVELADGMTLTIERTDDTDADLSPEDSWVHPDHGTINPNGDA